MHWLGHKIGELITVSNCLWCWGLKSDIVSKYYFIYNKLKSLFSCVMSQVLPHFILIQMPTKNYSQKHSQNVLNYFPLTSESSPPDINLSHMTYWCSYNCSIFTTEFLVKICPIRKCLTITILEASLINFTMGCHIYFVTYVRQTKQF